jgi:6-phosphogluconolactonase
VEKALEDRRTLVFDTPGELASGVAEEFLRFGKEALAGAGRFSVALSGGTTPRAAYEEIASRGGEFDWTRTHFFWSDERCVPLDTSQSNFRMAKEFLLTRIPVPPENVLPWETYRPVAEAVDAYENRLGIHFGTPLPAFDWVFLGVGADGHTASLFPESPALDEARRPVAASYVPKVEGWRLTLTFPALNAAKRCVVLAQGSEKAGIVHRVLEGRADLPAGRVRARETIWMMDREAASGAFP